MNDQELAKLRQTIERIEKMPPEEKAKLTKRIGKFHKMSPNQVDAMRKKYQSIPKEQRKAMHQRWMEMSPKERAEWRTKLRNMPRDERKAVFEAQGFLAPPPHRDKKDPDAMLPARKESKSPRGPKPQLEAEENEI
jgi:uncharacterized protein (UPF0335 family)